MDTLSYKTASANSKTTDKRWLLVDAENEVLGRLASKVAKMIRGKNKTNFTPHVDCGDNVIIINAEKIQLTGNKWNSKEYVRHTGYPGGQRLTSVKQMLDKKPTEIIRNATRGMLPKNKLGNAIIKNLHIYTGNQHPHDAQKPEKVNLNSIK